MHPYESAQAPKDFKMTSVILYEVSTFPPTTAASAFGFSIDYSGIKMVIGLKHPAFNGISLLSKALRQ